MRVFTSGTTCDSPCLPMSSSVARTFRDLERQQAQRAKFVILAMGWRCVTRAHPGQENLELRAPIQLRLYDDVAVALADDAVYSGKSQPGSSVSLCGEERLEQVLLHLFAHPHAGVG